MADDIEDIFEWGEDFEAILAILEEDETVDLHFTSATNETQNEKPSAKTVVKSTRPRVDLKDTNWRNIPHTTNYANTDINGRYGLLSNRFFGCNATVRTKEGIALRDITNGCNGDYRRNADLFLLTLHSCASPQL